MQIGNQIEGVTKALGVKPCGGCSRRKELLNGNGRWSKPWEIPAGWTLEKPEALTPETRVAMFVHGSGKRIIWEVEDGKYRRSSGFCCEGMKASAEARYASLCR